LNDVTNEEEGEYKVTKNIVKSVQIYKKLLLFFFSVFNLRC